MIINSNTAPRRNKEGLIVNDLKKPTQTVVPDSSVLDRKVEGDKHFAYEWRIPTTEVTISHNLDKRPSVTVIDTSGNELIGDIKYDDENNLTLSFSAPVRGTAYLN